MVWRSSSRPMHKRATSSIRIDDGLVLRPASKIHISDIVEAFEETWPEVIRAMPWINPDIEIRAQIEDFINDTETKGKSGILHHWVMIRPWDGYLLGLVGFDRVTRSNKAMWNLGYWVRSSEQRHGYARKSIDATLGWIRHTGNITVEMKVDPNNLPGSKTVQKTVKKWGGERHASGDSAITVAGVRTRHECHLIHIGPS
jgi:RimJ/RimL family protein N-acetyltransferase